MKDPDAQMLEPRAFVVTAGEYSGHSILGVFRSFAAARAAFPGICRLGLVARSDDLRIEQYPLDRLPSSVANYAVDVDNEGNEVNRVKGFQRETDAPEPWSRAFDDGARARGISIRCFDAALNAARGALAQAKTKDAAERRECSH